ncbi:unnamed protein product [Chondrus crispus]|uniref:Uncharacterized protein n=1 Tax=Chondrus crispus TaxID=2769 RepID=R7QVC2_CHOCR|nr:unnamed protein product [Chondrus crispus]CDF41295.1 unnamed protein product [Chondrus crispus]|eukprot:XP_005711589.1 unnamed protein product [Chondrus crispus]
MRSDDIDVDLPVLSEALREAFEPSNEVLAASRKRGIVNRFNNFTLIGIVGKLLMLGTRFPFVFNDYFLNNLRCLGMLEGLALNADPNFNVLGVVYPYVAKKILTNSRPRYRRTLEGLVIDQYGRMRWSRMDRLLQDVQDTAATTSGKHEEHMMDLIRFSDSRPAALPSGDDESWKESVREGGNENKRAEEIAGPVGTLKRRRRKERAMTTQKNSADLVLGFITSSHGQFLRKYIIQQYTMDMAKRWRRRIDRVTSWRSDAGEGVKPENSSSDSSTGLVGRGRSKYDVLHQMALRATERELSDDEARLRTRLFFRRTPISKRFHVLGRLAPGFVLPVLGTLLGLVVYFLQRVFGLVQERGQDGEDAFARVGVGAEGNGAVKDERAEGEVRRWSIDEEERRLQSWQPLDSVFLKRTQATPRREASSSSAEAAKSMG